MVKFEFAPNFPGMPMGYLMLQCFLLFMGSKQDSQYRGVPVSDGQCGPDYCFAMGGQEWSYTVFVDQVLKARKGD